MFVPEVTEDVFIDIEDKEDEKSKGMKSISTPKPALPVLSIVRKEILHPENKNLPIDRISKKYIAGKYPDENRSIPSEIETSGKEMNSSKSRKKEVFCVNPMTQKIANNKDDYESDESSQSNDNVDHYIDVEGLSDNENPLEAPELLKSTSSKDKLSRFSSETSLGESKGNKKKQHHCPNQCGNFFALKGTLQKHIRHDCGKLHSRQSLRYKCGYCDTRSEYSYSIMRHVRKHHRMQKQSVYDSWLDEFVQMRGDSKNKNRKLSKANTVNQYECPNKCGSYFYHLCNISRHIRRTCINVQRFECPYCKYRARIFLSIKKHIEIKHKLMKVCAINIFTKQTVYQDIKRMKRNLEDTSTNSRVKVDNVKSPTRSAEEDFACGRVRFECPYCPKQCIQKWSISAHIKRCHPGMTNFIIDCIKKRVIYKSRRAMHCEDFDSIQDSKVREVFEKSKIATSIAERKRQTMLKCPLCSKLCKYTRNLTMHMKFRHPHSKIDNVQPEKQEVKDAQEENYQEANDPEEVEDFIDEIEEVSKDASDVECLDVVGDTDDAIIPSVSSVASADHSLSSEVKDTSDVYEKPETIKCPKCQYRCESKINMMNHVTIHDSQHEAARSYIDLSKEPFEENDDVVLEEESAEIDINIIE